MTDLIFHIGMNSTKVLFLQLHVHQEIPRILRHSNVHFRVHKTPALNPILSQLSTVYVPPYSLKINFNIILPSMFTSSKWSLSLRSSTKTIYAYIFLPTHATCHAPSLFFSIRSPPKKYLVSCIDHGASNYAVFSTPQLYRPSWAPISSPALSLQTPSTNFPTSKWHTKFLTQTKQEAKLEPHVYQLLHSWVERGNAISSGPNVSRQVVKVCSFLFGNQKEWGLFRNKLYRARPTVHIDSKVFFFLIYYTMIYFGEVTA